MKGFGKVLISSLLFLFLIFAERRTPPLAQGLDFIQLYERGKFLIQKKFYKSAIKTLRKASFTPRGRNHFGVYYYLALANYFLPSVQDAINYIRIAKTLAKTKKQKAAIQKLHNKIVAFYGSFSIVPEVDPEEVGKVKLNLKPATPFSNPHKKRYFLHLNQRLSSEGTLPNSQPIFIPKGDYTISIVRPQCFEYGLSDGEKLVSKISVSEETVQLFLVKKPSCHCIGGQKLYRKDGKFFCACPPGLGWNKKTNRCEKGVDPIPWILAGIGTVVVGTTAVIIGLVVSNMKDFEEAGGINKGSKPNQPFAIGE